MVNAPQNNLLPLQSSDNPLALTYLLEKKRGFAGDISTSG